MLINSLSETDWLSEPHPFSKVASSLSEYKTLEEDKSEISALSAKPARPTRICLFSRLAHPSSLSGFSLTLAQRDMLAERAFVC